MPTPSKIDHLGIAVPSIAEAEKLYRDAMGLTCEGVEEVPDQKVRVAFYSVGETRIELLEPTTPDSPIAKFIEKRGPGMHHVAYRVDDVVATLRELEAAGVQLIDKEPRKGAHGMSIAFAHPKSTGGVLVEFCQKG